MADVTELLNQGLSALSAGEREKARDLLKQAMEEDPNNIAVWEALAQSTDDIDEKRIALVSILQLDASNSYAKTELASLEQEKSQSKADEEIVPGITRGQVRKLVLGLSLLTVLVLGVTFTLRSNITSTYYAGQTAIALDISGATETFIAPTNAAATVQFDAANTATQQSIDAQATAFALNSPTPTATSTRSRELPTAIPPTVTPTATPADARQAPPPPSNLAGNFLVWGGVNPSSRTYLSLLQLPAIGGDERRVNSDVVQFATTDSLTSKIIYLRSLQNFEVLWVVGQDRNVGEDVSQYFSQFGIRDPRNPRLSRLGNHLVFIAFTEQLGANAVFMYNFQTRQAVRLTSDIAEYENVAVSPDGALVVAAKRSAGGTDLILINAVDSANGYPQSALTANGDVSVEAFPDFDSTGTLLVFQARDATSNQHDLYIGRLLGTPDTGFSFAGPPQSMVTAPSDEVYPMLSPDGQYVAYSSNLGGEYGLYVSPVNDGATRYQVSLTLPLYLAAWTN